MVQYSWFERAVSANTVQLSSGTFWMLLWRWFILNTTLKWLLFSRSFPHFTSANRSKIVQPMVFRTSKTFGFCSVLVLNYFRFPWFFLSQNICRDTTFSNLLAPSWIYWFHSSHQDMLGPHTHILVLMSRPILLDLSSDLLKEYEHKRSKDCRTVFHRKT